MRDTISKVPTHVQITKGVESNPINAVLVFEDNGATSEENKDIEKEDKYFAFQDKIRPTLDCTLSSASERLPLPWR